MLFVTEKLHGLWYAWFVVAQSGMRTRFEDNRRALNAFTSAAKAGTARGGSRG